MNLIITFEFLTGHEWERAPESPCGACPDRDGQLLQAPPTAEQREQQHLEEGQKFKQQVQKQRAGNQQRAAEAAKHKRKPWCGLVRQALNYILRGVRIGADRVKKTLFLRGAERVHVPTVQCIYGVFGGEITRCTVIYGVYRVGQNRIYTPYVW